MERTPALDRRQLQTATRYSLLPAHERTGDSAMSVLDLKGNEDPDGVLHALHRLEEPTRGMVLELMELTLDDQKLRRSGPSRASRRPPIA